MCMFCCLSLCFCLCFPSLTVCLPVCLTVCLSFYLLRCLIGLVGNHHRLLVIKRDIHHNIIKADLRNLRKRGRGGVSRDIRTERRWGQGGQEVGEGLRSYLSYLTGLI